MDTALYSESSHSFAPKEKTTLRMLLVISSAGNLFHIYLSYINSVTCSLSASATYGKSLDLPDCS